MSVLSGLLKRCFLPRKRKDMRKTGALKPLKYCVVTTSLSNQIDGFLCELAPLSHDTIFAITSGAVGCPYDNPWSRQ